MNRTEYTIQTERSRSQLTGPGDLKVSHFVNYPDRTVAKASKWGTITFSTPIWAGAVRERHDGTITAFLAVRKGPNKNLGTFRTVQEAIETVIDFDRAYREVGIELW